MFPKRERARERESRFPLRPWVIREHRTGASQPINHLLWDAFTISWWVLQNSVVIESSAVLTKHHGKFFTYCNIFLIIIIIYLANKALDLTKSFSKNCEQFSSDFSFFILPLSGMFWGMWCETTDVFIICSIQLDFCRQGRLILTFIHKQEKQSNQQKTTWALQMKIKSIMCTVPHTVERYIYINTVGP